MNEKKIEAFAKELVELANLLKDGDTLPATNRSMSFLAGEKQVAFAGPDTDAFDEVSGRVYRESGWSQKYSESHVSDLLRKLLARLYLDNTLETAKQGLAGLVAEHQAYQKHQIVLVPLFGIELHVPVVKVGQVHIFRPSDEELQRRLGKNVVTPLGQYVLDNLSGSVLSEFRTVAEPIRAKERAVEETRRAIEVFRYAIPFVHPDGYKSLGINVSVMGDHPDSEFLSFIMPSGDDNKMTFTSESNRPAIPFRLNEDTLKTFGECGGSALSNMLEKPVTSVTDMENVILRGVHWFGNALCQSEPENELLNLTTCLETFLTPRDGNPIGTAIAEGVAILLGNQLAERKRLKKKVKDLYGKRSGVSHGGEKAVLESDLMELREIAKSLIRKVISLGASLNSQKELLEMIEDKKLG